MSLYAQYVKEREGFDTLETDRGFATYKCQGENVYLRDIYVAPQYRNSKLASDMADEVAIKAKEKGCKFMLGTVDPGLPSATASTKVLLAYGMKIITASNTAIVFSKEI